MGASLPVSTNEDQPTGMAFILKKAFLSALIALGLFSLMVGIRTEAGPTGQLVFWTRFEELAELVAAVFVGSIAVELFRRWLGPLAGTAGLIPKPVQRGVAFAGRFLGPVMLGIRPAGPGDLLQSALPSRSRHPGADLRDAGLGPQRRGRSRRPARPRLCRLLRSRRLFLCPAVDHIRPVVLGLPAAGRASSPPYGACCSASPCCGCAATTSPS